MRFFAGAFPDCNFEAFKLPAPGQDGLDQWTGQNRAPRGTLTVDPVLRSCADFCHGSKIKPLEGGVFKFVDVDPLFVQKVAGRPEDRLPFVGKFHIFLMGQRRVALSGRFDFDHSDQEKLEDMTMNEIIRAMEERRSIRKFKPDMPKKADLDQIIEAGLYAASAKGKQSAIIVAVTNRELRDKISVDNCRIGGWDKDFDPFYGAPAILIVLADKTWANRVYDGSLVMGNMMLAAHSLGLGSIWINRAREEFETEEYKKLLGNWGIKGEWEGIGHCAVGYRDGELPQPAPRKPGRVFYVE